MDAVSAMDVCILLVDADLSISVRVSQLLRSKYKVVTAGKGEDAMRMLYNKQYGINLVMTDINLPDVSAFEFVRTVDKDFKLPVVVICDTHDESTINKGLLCGAMLCLVKPLCFHDIKGLWQFLILKQKEVMREHCQVPMAGFPETETRPNEAIKRKLVVESNGFPTSGCLRSELVMHESSGSQSYKRSKMDELERGNGWSMGQSSSFVWTPELYNRFLRVVKDIGIWKASPSAIWLRMNAPGLTITHVVERLKTVHVYFRQFTRLPPEIVCHDETSCFAQDSPPMTSQSMESGACSNNCELLYKQPGDSPFARYLQDPHCREQLKSIVKGALRRWTPEYGPYAHQQNILNQGAMWHTQPPPATMYPGASSQAPPASVPVAMAKDLESFIHTSLSAQYSPPAVMHAQAPLAALLGESGFSKVEDENFGLDSNFLDNFDTEDLFATIMELLDA